MNHFTVIIFWLLEFWNVCKSEYSCVYVWVHMCVCVRIWVLGVESRALSMPGKHWTPELHFWSLPGFVFMQPDWQVVLQTTVFVFGWLESTGPLKGNRGTRISCVGISASLHQTPPHCERSVSFCTYSVFWPSIKALVFVPELRTVQCKLHSSLHHCNKKETRTLRFSLNWTFPTLVLVDLISWNAYKYYLHCLKRRNTTKIQGWSRSSQDSWPLFWFVSVDTTTQRDLGEGRVDLAYVSQPSPAETVEKQCLLTCFLWFAQSAFW